MLVIETMTDGRVHTYSDTGMYIRQNETGTLYEDAVDVPGRYTYTETTVLIPDPQDDEATPEDYEAALNEMGVPT